MIELFKESRPEIDISIIAVIDANGDLSVLGSDSGKLVQELRGDWNYEYKAIVKKEDKDILLEKLREQNVSLDSDEDLMSWLKVNYNHNEAYSKFIELLKELVIKHSTFMWP